MMRAIVILACAAVAACETAAPLVVSTRESPVVVTAACVPKLPEAPAPTRPQLKRPPDLDCRNPPAGDYRCAEYVRAAMVDLERSEAYAAKLVAALKGCQDGKPTP